MFFEISVGSNLFHIITIIDFIIQLNARGIIHHKQCLTLDCLAFDLAWVTKHGHYLKSILDNICIFVFHGQTYIFKYILLLKEECLIFK
jgi:hypothetical protein